MEFRKMLMITLYAEQKKRHRFIEQSFRLCGRRRGWDVSPIHSFKVSWFSWFLVYSELSDHYHYLFPEHHHDPKKNATPISRNFLILSSPASGNNESVSMDLPILYIIYKWNDTVYGFSVWLLSLSIIFQGSSMF